MVSVAGVEGEGLVDPVPVTAAHGQMRTNDQQVTVRCEKRESINIIVVS